MEEEPEIQEPTTVQEQLNTETSRPTKLNKNGKPRKQLSPEALNRLAKAREKANAMRQQAYAKKLEEKVEKLRQKPVINKEEQNPLTDSTTGIGVTTNEVIDPEPAEVKEVVEKKVKPKEKGKKKTKIIVEQSSDDSDEFEPNDNVVFVKRVSRKKKDSVPEPVKDSTTGIGVPPIERQLGMELPPRPQLTPEQRILKSQYENMFSGGFMNQGNLMRRHY